MKLFKKKETKKQTKWKLLKTNFLKGIYEFSEQNRKSLNEKEKRTMA
jgi:hypothetical protein